MSKPKLVTTLQPNTKPPTAEVLGFEAPITVHAPDGLNVENTMSGINCLLDSITCLVSNAALHLDGSGDPEVDEQVRNLYAAVPLLNLAQAYAAAAQDQASRSRRATEAAA